MSDGPSVRLFNYAFDENDGDIILRGSLDLSSLDNLLLDVYQRELLPRKGSLGHWTEQLSHGLVPDIELGMRGGNFSESCHDNRKFANLLDPVYIVDGQQRKTAASNIYRLGGSPRLGAIVRFNTNEGWERDRFHTLNSNATRHAVSANILVRNQESDYAAIQMLRDLTLDSSFPLCRRICWDQRMKTGHLLAGFLFLKVSAKLHSHFGAGLTQASQRVLVTAFQRLVDRLGHSTVRKNISTFFGVIDECWGIRPITFKKEALCLRGAFLSTLANLMAGHQNFWADSELDVNYDLRRSLRTFNLHDPYIRNLISSTGSSHSLLYGKFIEHLNKGKHRRLVQFESEQDVRPTWSGIEQEPPSLAAASEF